MSNAKADPLVILLVDRSPLFASTMSSVLQNAHAVLHIAHDSASLSRILQEKRPDLVVLERELPDESGEDACRRLKSDPRCAHVPVILTTFEPVEEAAAAVEETGADGFLQKPFRPVRLLEWIERHADLFPEGRELPHDAHPLRRRGDPSRPGILLVDDDPVARAFLEDALRPLEYPLTFTSDWMGFRDAIFERDYGVLVIDIGLPGLDGEVLADFSREFLEMPRPRIVLFSGRERAELERIREHVGAFRIVEKDVAGERLVDAVRAAMDSYHLAAATGEGSAGA